ncbi:hypothetical protein FAI40_06385 [Acetobacteraceae bacterium]|nr:hypothetical protein FAI40_06385 [Acetobacteraceae bacterium]
MSDQFDKDWIGTKSGYEYLKSLGKDLRKCTQRYQLITEVSGVLNFASPLLDPQEESLSPFAYKNFSSKLENIIETVEKASEKLFSFDDNKPVRKK